MNSKSVLTDKLSDFLSPAHGHSRQMGCRKRKRLKINEEIG